MSKSKNINIADSSELDDLFIQNKKNNEYLSIILGVSSQLIWALYPIQLKTYEKLFPENFSNNSLIFWRSLPIWILGYIICKQRQVRIKPFSEIKNKFWFIIINLGNYIIIYLLIQILKYLRVFTAQAISECCPILFFFLSIPILNGNFSNRYIFGAIICLFGSGIIIMNESSLEDKKTKLNNNFSTGIYLIFCHLVLSSLHKVGQKILCLEELSSEEQNYYFGMSATLPALIFCIIESNFGIGNVLYILYAISNGLCIFLGDYIFIKALNNLPDTKTKFISYLYILFIFILSFILLKEKIFISDPFGAGLIIGFQLYNEYYPPFKKKGM